MNDEPASRRKINWPFIVVLILGVLGAVPGAVVLDGWVRAGHDGKPPSVEPVASLPQTIDGAVLAQLSATPVVPVRLPSVVLSQEKPFRPDTKLPWTCTGDLLLRQDDGTVTQLYDTGVADTGLVVVLPQSFTGVVEAPYGGYCEAASQAGLEVLVDAKVSEMFGPPNCTSSGCVTVHVVRIDEFGHLLSDEVVRR